MRFLLIFLSLVYISFSEPILWQNIKLYTYKDAIKESQKEKKPVLLYFYGKDCAYCQLMDDRVFSKKDLESFINKNFILAGIDTDSSGGYKIAQKFGIYGEPSFVILDYKTDRPKFKFFGYKTKEQLVYLLKKALNK